jgi:hypothetical protein
MEEQPLKLTIEPTGDADQRDNYPTVTASLETNEASIEEVVPLLRTLLIGWGFHPDIVKDLLPDE